MQNEKQYLHTYPKAVIHNLNSLCKNIVLIDCESNRRPLFSIATRWSQKTIEIFQTKLLYLTVSTLSVLLLSCNEGIEMKNKAVNYNEKIVTIQSKADAAFVEALKSLESSDKQDIIITYEINRDKTKQLLEKAKKTNSFKNNKEFNIALISLLGTLLEFYDDELAELTDILIKDPQDVTSVDFEIIYKCYNSMSEKYSIVTTDFLDAQKKFAKEYNLKLK